jgi:flagellar motor switch protein FliN/FliY
VTDRLVTDSLPTPPLAAGGPPSGGDARLVAAAARAAEAAAAALPTADTLLPGTPVSTSAGVTLGAGAAVLARLARRAEAGVGPRGGAGADGEVAVLVGPDLVQALAASPLGALDVVPAVQPALDAAAATLGMRAEAGVSVEAAVALDTSGQVPTVVVPLLAGDVVRAAVVVRLGTVVAHVPSPGGPPAAEHASAPATGVRPGLELLHDVAMEVTVELGRTRMTVRDLLALAPGALVELDRAAGSPADLLVHGTLIARGEIVVIDEEFGLRITEIVTDGGGGES